MIKKNKGILLFTILFGLFLIPGGIILIAEGKGAIAILINQALSSKIMDNFFIYFTMLGLGSVFFAVVIILGFHKIYNTFLGIIILFLNGLLTFVFKQLLFKGMPRPTKYLDTESLNLIENFDYHSMNSFPSGHTFTAFAMFSFLAFIFNKKWLSVLFFILAAAIGFSRIYLLQHFFMDVYTGAILGVITTIGVIWIAETLNWKNKLKKLDRPYF